MDYLAAPDSRTELFDLVDGSSQGLFLDERDAMFLVAVEEGNLELVQSMLNQDNRPVNINAINSDGLTALQIALENKREEIVKELVDKGADLKLALLQSVFDNDLDCAKMLLTRKSESETKHSDSYISPIILATQMGLYEMVHLLLKNEHFIRLPHQYCCDCEQCEKKSDMLRSQIAINRFRGLSSPTYMCLSYMVENCGKEDPDSHNLAMKDPVTQAFELNTMLERRADEEPEFKKEYLKLSERCKRFSVDLYNECRSMEEITALLDIDEHQFNLSRRTRIKKESRANVMKIFRRAIKSDHKEFVAHPHSQQLLNIVVYSGIPQWRRISFFYKLFICLIYTLIFPILVGIYIFFPHHKISQLMSSPFVKFASHTSQFILFLVLLVLSALQNNHVPNVLEYLIFTCVLGMVVQEVVEMLGHRPRRSYFFKWWNIVTTVMLTLFVVAALLWLAGFAITGDWSVFEFSKDKFKAKTGHRFLLVGNSFFSLAIVVSVFHLLDLCQVNSVLGPLQLSLYRMLRDVIKFLLIFSAVFFAFAMGVRNLYSYYNSLLEEIREHYGTQNGTEMIEKDHPLSTFSGSTKSMFWALFDKIDLDVFNTDDHTFKITQKTGKWLFAFYSICAVMVALNMLIAMMTHSYDYISQDDDVQWKFSRTQLWLEFVEKGSAIPAPYNLIPNPRIIYRFIRKHLFTGRIKHYKNRTPSDDKKKVERKNVIKNLVRRYFLKQESQRKKELSTLKDIEDCKSEIIKVLRENSETKGTT